jgi:hypothetical protein
MASYVPTQFAQVAAPNDSTTIAATMAALGKSPYGDAIDNLQKLLVGRIGRAIQSDLEAKAIADMANGKDIAKIDPRLVGSEAFQNAWKEHDSSDRAWDSNDLQWTAEARQQRAQDEAFRITRQQEQANSLFGKYVLDNLKYGDDYTAEQMRTPEAQAFFNKYPDFASKFVNWLQDKGKKIGEVDPTVDVSGMDHDAVKDKIAKTGVLARDAASAYQANVQKLSEALSGVGTYDSKTGKTTTKSSEEMVRDLIKEAGYEGTSAAVDARNNLFGAIANVKARLKKAVEKGEISEEYLHTPDALIAKYASQAIKPSGWSWVPWFGRYAQGTIDENLVFDSIKAQPTLTKLVSAVREARRNAQIYEDISAKMDQLNTDLIAARTARNAAARSNDPIRLAAATRQERKILAEIQKLESKDAAIKESAGDSIK